MELLQTQLVFEETSKAAKIRIKNKRKEANSSNFYNIFFSYQSQFLTWLNLLYVLIQKKIYPEWKKQHSWIFHEGWSCAWLRCPSELFAKCISICRERSGTRTQWPDRSRTYKEEIAILNSIECLVRTVRLHNTEFKYPFIKLE